MKKKIVVIQSYELFPDPRLSKELSLLTTLDADVHCIIWKRSGDDGMIGSFPGVKTHIVDIPSVYGMSVWQHIGMQRKFRRAVFAKLKFLKPDLIIGQNIESVLAALRYRFQTWTPLIYVSREPFHKIMRQ
ncbi:MAG: hypothetical protein ACI9BD_001515, partial [Candidatus Marinamargulisbacteria bacterium]